MCEEEIPDFECIFHMKNRTNNCRFKSYVSCTGLKEDRKRCPKWN